MPGKQGAGPLTSLLNDFIKEGQFDNAFIADENGFPLIFAGSNMESSETQAAVFARINKTVAMVDAHKGLGNVDEMVFDITGKKKLVCRNFAINKKNLILIVTMDSLRRYKRLTGTLVHQLQKIWDI